MAGLGRVSLLTTSYTIDDAAGVGANLAVVQGASDGSCKKPTAANAAGFLGVTQTTQTKQNKGVSVGKLGIFPVRGKGAITRGDRLQIADNVGRVQSAEATVAAGLANPAAVVNVVGQAENSTVSDDDIVYMFVCPQTVALAVS